MNITNDKDKDVFVKDIDSWEKAFNNPKNWKEGRSAHSLAYYFTNPSIESSDGIKLITRCLNILGMSEISYDNAIIEHASQFDKYRNKRKQDLVIWGKCDEKGCVVCIEAKVDESFNNYVSKEYEKACRIKNNKPKSNQKERIEELCDKYFYGKSPQDSELNKIRYQLLYYLAGSICEAQNNNRCVFMPIMVFHTNDFNVKKGEQNKQDFLHFIQKLEFEKIVKEDIVIYYKNILNVDVYCSYLEIDLNS